MYEYDAESDKFIAESVNLIFRCGKSILVQYSGYTSVRGVYSEGEDILKNHCILIYSGIFN